MTSVAQALVDRLSFLGCKDFYGVSGGAALHILHAAKSHPKVRLRTMNHEQSAAMAAEAQYRSSGNLAACVATSGPGATNLITGIAGAYYDSVPLIVITGQVSTNRRLIGSGVRQYGFQETPIDSLVEKIAKGVFYLDNPSDVLRVVDEAVNLAISGRPGPVLLDIPDDVQRVTIDLRKSQRGAISSASEGMIQPPASKIQQLENLLSESRRPVLVAGNGIPLEEGRDDFGTLVETLGVPVVLTWGGGNLLSSQHPLNFGFFGTHGSRHANYIIQNSDLVIAIGSRLDTKSTGSPPKSFARLAKKVMVDIDISELNKFSLVQVEIDLRIHSDSVRFIQSLLAAKLVWNVDQSWIAFCNQARDELSQSFKPSGPTAGINPHHALSKLFAGGPEAFDLFVDTGTSLPYAMAAFPFDSNRRLFHDFNNTAMGWSIPAAIGGSSASPNRTVIALLGDGSLMMTAGELTTLAKLSTSPKIILLANRGHSMIRQTQDQWFGGEYVSSSDDQIAFPDFEQLLSASGFKAVRITTENLHKKVGEIWDTKGPIAGILDVDPGWRVEPQVVFGDPIEDQSPKLPRKIHDYFMKHHSSRSG